MLTQTTPAPPQPAASGAIARRLRAHGAIPLLAVSSAWAVILALILSHRVFITNDSVNNYAHVWYIADRLWHGRDIPFHMPEIGHGEAYAFPYGSIPWLTAALLRPIFGDWVVTLWLVLGALGVIAAMIWAFPELRTAWWTSLLLLNPVLVEAPVLGQLPFLWGAALLFVAIGSWRRDRPLAAAVVAAAAQATHPAVILPLAAGVVAVRLVFDHRPRALAAWYALSLVLAAPAVWMTLRAPIVEETSRGSLLANFFATVGLRSLVVAAPFIALALARTSLARAPALIAAALLAFNIIFVPLRDNAFAWGALTRTPDTSLDAFVSSDAFAAGATYRIQRASDGKYGMYDLLRHGARLDSEFFPESLARRSWDTADEYAAFLHNRHVDYVVIYGAYDRHYGTNEHALLESLARTPAHAEGDRLCTTLAAHYPAFDVYAVHHPCTPDFVR